MKALTVMLAAAIMLVPGAGADPGDRSAEHCAKLPAPPGNAHGIDKQCPGGGSSAGVARADFNGDGFGDLAIGISGEDIVTSNFLTGKTTQQNAGAVQVIYGTADGLDATGADAAVPAQLWHQNVAGVESIPDDNENFGRSLAAGDFNNDGRSELAVAVPYETGGAAVHVFQGSENGLTATGDVLLTAATFGADSATFSVDALAWGNFDGDEFGDLAVGSAYAPAGGVAQAGVVHVLYGTQTGLGTARRQTWSQASTNVPDDPETGDRFGAVLSAGDFDGNEADDLVVGLPSERISAVADPRPR